MTPRDWLTSRQHTPAARGKHRATPPDIKETSLSPSLAASLPGPMPRPLAESPAIAAALVAAGTDRVVECGFCHVSGLASQIPETAGGEHRCSDIEECVQRSIRYEASGEHARPLVHFPAPEPLPKREAGTSLVAEPLPLPQPAAADQDPCPIEVHLDGDRFPCQLTRHGPDTDHKFGPREPWPDEADDLAPLPPVQEAALAAFNALTDEQDAAEKAAAKPAPETGPSDAEEAQYELLRDAVEVLRGPLAGSLPETRTEDEESAQDSAPAPVAEDGGEEK